MSTYSQLIEKADACEKAFVESSISHPDLAEKEMLKAAAYRGAASWLNDAEAEMKQAEQEFSRITKECFGVLDRNLREAENHDPRSAASKVRFALDAALVAMKSARLNLESLDGLTTDNGQKISTKSSIEGLDFASSAVTRARQTS